MKTTLVKFGFWMLVIVALPLVVVGSWRLANYAWQKTVPKAESQGTVAMSDEANAARTILEQSKQDSSVANDLKGKAMFALQIATQRSEAMDVGKQAANITNRVEKYYYATVVTSSVTTRDDNGELAKTFKLGQVIRYYPRLTPKIFPGDTKIYLFGGVYPYEDDDFFWFARETVKEQVDEFKSLAWKIIFPSDPRVISEWLIELAPGQESPPLTIAVDKCRTYNIDYMDDTNLVWSVNSSVYQPLTKVGPSMNGPSIIRFLLDPRSEQSEMVRFALTK